MQINTCLRCNRSWCYRGTGRACRCGVCKSPYWDRPHTFSATGNVAVAGVRPETEQDDSTLLGNILHNRGMGTSVHRSDNAPARKSRRAQEKQRMGTGSLDSVVGIDLPGANSLNDGREEVDSHSSAYPQHSEQMKAELRSICDGNVPKQSIPDPEPAEDCTPECCECGHKLTGKVVKGVVVAWACPDLGCAMYGIEQR